MAELSTVARPYGKAAFQYAVAAGDLARWSEQLATAAAVSRQESMRKVMTSPALTAEQQAQTFIDVCGDALGDKARNFIRTLARNKRLILLPEIYALFEAQKAAHEKSVDIEVTAARALDADAERKLSEALSRRLERQVKLRTAVDEQLLGGAVIRAGDLVIDGSVRGRLAKLAEAIKS